MIAKNKKNRFVKVISIFLVGIFVVFIAFMPFMLNKNKDNVLADSVVSGSNISFYSSSTILPVNLVGVNDVSAYANLPSHSPLYLNLAFVLRNFNIGGDLVSPSLFFDTTGYSGQNFVMTRDSYYMYLNGSSWYKAKIASSFLLEYDTYKVVGLFPSAFLYNDYRIICEYYLSSSFNFNVVRCLIEQETGFLAGGYNGNRVVLYDTNNNVFQLHFPLNTSNFNSWALPYSYDKDYYLIDPSNLTDNDFYNQGKFDGYNEGKRDGLIEGADDAYNAGYDAGEDYGYNQGLVAGANVSWTNMFGAMVDVPVSSLVSMLDFNLNLGGQNFNLYHFLLAILTLAITIAIVRLILAKGGK